MKRVWGLLLLIICGLGMVACTVTPSTDPATGETEAGEQVIVTWYQYDQNNEDPASDERVGNEYLRRHIPLFNETFAGQWRWENQPKAFDRMVTELIAAVQAAGEVPDVIHIGDSNLLALYRNGAVQPLDEWAEAQDWFDELDPNAVAACRAPDGQLYCIPIAQTPQVVFVWKDRFPDGYPTTPEEFLQRAAELKEEGLYAITFFGSTDYGGEGINRFVWTTISSFGGTFDDGQGTMTLNTPENIAAIEFMREIVTQGYAPEIAFAGQFQEEQAFKDASAGSFPTAVFGYRYVNPLTAPNGTVYGKGNEEDMLDAIAGGDVVLAPFVAAEGQQPGCNIGVSALSIPVGAQNLEGAQAYINWVMSAEQNPEWVLGLGGGFPVLASTQEAPTFQSEFHQQAAKVIASSACRPWYGSLERRDEAKRLIMNVVYELIKADPTADIATALSEVEAEYNAGE
jgi:multiple sugar transport system substrate-binding protein